MTVQAVDQNYAGHGVIEGYVTLNDVPGIANTQGVGSVILELRPMHSAVTAQSVNQHRVNRINSDRKSTRLNSSHSQISYAVFCLKKKKNKSTTQHIGPHVSTRTYF